jgi:two-component system cell cycle response regulator
MVRQAYNVLLVEDVPLLARIAEQMLKKSPAHRYAVTLKATLREAVAALQQEEFHVILLDLNLPDSAELATLTAVADSAPHVPIIVLTATQGHEIGYQAIKLGAQDFLVKGDFNYLSLDRAIIYSFERHRLQRTLRQLAVIDELTGLYNRRGFNTLNGDVLQRVQQSESRGYLCYFDLDRFKEINDEQGHQKGDEALVEFAGNLRSIFKKDCLLVRLGGDEFLAMGLEHAPGEVEEALQALEIVLSVRNRPGACDFVLEASSGLAYFDKNGAAAIEDLAAVADAALYHNKVKRHARADLLRAGDAR